MTRMLQVSCPLVAMILALATEAAPPAKDKRPGSQPPPKIATPTPITMAVAKPFDPPPCTVVGTVTYDAAAKAKAPMVERYTGSMTFTANLDLFAVTVWTMNYNPGGYVLFLGSCDCPSCPKGGDNPAAAPATSNFKRTESRTYPLVCAWPNGGIPASGTYQFKVSAAYFFKTATGFSEKKQAECGELTVVK